MPAPNLYLDPQIRVRLSLPLPLLPRPTLTTLHPLGLGSLPHHLGVCPSLFFHPHKQRIDPSLTLDPTGW